MNTFPKCPYTLHYWQFHEKLVNAATKEIQRYPTVDANEQVRNILAAANEQLQQGQKRWERLFAAHTEPELQAAFSSWETDARNAIREEMLCVSEAFFYRFALNILFEEDMDYAKVPPLLPWSAPLDRAYEAKRARIIQELSAPPIMQQFHLSQRGTPWYETEKQEKFAQIWKYIEEKKEVEALAFTCDFQTLRSFLTMDRLQWTVEYQKPNKVHTDEYERSSTPGLVKDKYRLIPAFDHWHLVEGQEEILLPFIEPVVQVAIDEAKPIFEAHIRFLRDIQQALVAVPIAVTTSEMEQVIIGHDSTYETRAKTAVKLMNLEKYHCYIRLGVSDHAGKPLIKTLAPETGVSLPELETRFALIREQTKQYGTKPDAIERELQERRKRLEEQFPPRKEEKTPGTTATKREKKQAAPTTPATPLQANTPRSTPPPVSVASPVGLLFDDNYPLLLFHWFFLSLSQIKKLLQKKPTDTHVAERLKKHLADGLVQITEWKVQGRPGKLQKIYSLTDAGVTQVEKTYNLKSGSRKMALTDHTLAVNELLLPFCLLVKGEQAITLKEMQHELYFKSHCIKVVAVGLEPDGFVSLSLPSGCVSVYCEVDLGSENNVQWSEKMQKYLRALDAGLLGSAKTLVAVWIPNKRATATIRRWTEETLDTQGAKQHSGIFHFTNADPLALSPTDFISGSHWIQPFSKVEVSLLKTS